MKIDMTAGEVEVLVDNRFIRGKFVDYDPIRGVCRVMMDYESPPVNFSAGDVFIPREEETK